MIGLDAGDDDDDDDDDEKHSWPVLLGELLLCPKILPQYILY